MNRAGPIVVIEDDEDDQASLMEVFQELNLENDVIYFLDGKLAYDYLVDKPEEPFLIISDINMPKLNGLELREQIINNKDLNLKCIPYLFFSTSADPQLVVEAYEKSVQGFFVKPNSPDKL